MPNHRWNLRYAPHTGFRDPMRPLFRESAGSADPLEQIRYVASLGFAGIEDNRLRDRPADVQSRMGEALARHGLEMGCFVLSPDPAARLLWGSAEPSERERQRTELLAAIETAKRVNGRWITVTSMRDLGAPIAYQLANLVENLKRVREIAEKAGVVLCLEHVNAPRIPGMLLQHVADSYAVAAALDSPSVKIVFDFVHVQVMDGDLIHNIDATWNHIGIFQLADNPGRCEPGTGEINWVNVLRHVKNRGFAGLLELEHLCEKPGREGEQLALERLRAIDAAL